MEVRGIQVEESVLTPDPAHPGKRRVRVLRSRLVHAADGKEWWVAEDTGRVRLETCEHERSAWSSATAWEPSPFDARFERCAVCGAVRMARALPQNPKAAVLTKGD